MNTASLGAIVIAIFANPSAIESAPQDLPKGADLMDAVEAHAGAPEERAKIRNLVSEGKLKFAGMEQEGSVREIFSGKAPLQFHVVREFPGFGRFEEGSDPKGEVVWEKSPIDGVTIHRGEEASSRFATYASSLPFFGWREVFAKAECLALEEVAGVSCYKVRLTPKQGRSTLWYVEKETKRLRKVVSKMKQGQGSVVDIVAIVGDWRRVDGIEYPFRIDVSVGEFQIVQTVTSIKHNVELDAATFELPKDVAKEIAQGVKKPDDVPAIKIETVPMRHVAAIEVETNPVPSEISTQLSMIYPEVMMYIGSIGAKSVGPPFGQYWIAGGKMKILAGIPVEKPVPGKGRIEARELPGGRAVVGWHVGPYTDLPITYQRIADWAEKQEPPVKLGAFHWDYYWTDPGMEPDSSKWRSQIVWPLADQ